MSISATAPLVIFTPSAMAPDVLEAIFVKREALAERIVSSIKDSAKSPTKHHWLLVGQRGMGKTHLVALVYHRLQKAKGLSKKLRIAWLREESWEVTSYLDLLEVILQAIAQELTGEEASSLVERTDALLDIEGTRAEREAEALILEAIGSRTLLLIVENLDEVLDGIRTDGQRALRAFMETNERFAVLATTPALFDGVSRQHSPFYGYFTVEHLDELNFEEARELLSRVATLRGDPKLAAHLYTPTGEARLRVVAELAGGHPRIWILFATCLSIELIDELVPLFIKMLDDLTPYYQERMRALSPQQRRIVTHLAGFGGAQAVKDIARACRLSQPSAAKIIGDLETKGFLRRAPELDVPSSGDRRLALYELREPLMRLCLDVKESRGKPLRLIVEFLREWYGADLFALVSDIEDGSLAADYVNAAIDDLLRAPSSDELTTFVMRLKTYLVFALLLNLMVAMADEFAPSDPDADLPGVTREPVPDFDLAVFEGWVRKRVAVVEANGTNSRTAAALTATALPMVNSGLYDRLWQNIPEEFRGPLELTVDELQAAFEEWVRIWAAAAAQETFAVAHNVLSAAIHWRPQRDRSVLMRLPAEQRRLLQTMIKVKPDSGGEISLQIPVPNLDG